MNSKKLISVVLCAVLLTGCATVPVDSAGNVIMDQVANEKIVLKPQVKDRVDIALDVWCGNLTNIRRIVLRFIHAVDPQWQSVCMMRTTDET